METILELIQDSDVDVSSMIDIKIVILLLAIGFCVKHLPFMKKVSNEFIPLLLIVFSLTISFIGAGIAINTFISAILSASIAIGIHQQGKGFLKSFLDMMNKNTKGKD